MKTGQLLEYNLINIFLENHTQNVVEEPFPDPFLKKSKLSIFLDQYSKVLYVYIYIYFLFGKLRTIESD